MLYIIQRRLKMKTIYYIGTGKLNAIYTLRRVAMGDGFYADSFVRILASDAERAETNARAYLDRILFRGESQGFDTSNITFELQPDFSLFERSSKLSVKDTVALKAIENQMMPFGKHKGQEFKNLPDTYVLYWADQIEKASNVIGQMLAAAFMDIAIERNIIQERLQQKEIKQFQKVMSNHVGTVGEKIVLEGIVEWSGVNSSDYGSYEITVVKVGMNIVKIYGRRWTKGETIKFKGKVKKHEVYNDVRSTVVNYAKLIEE